MAKNLIQENNLDKAMRVLKKAETNFEELRVENESSDNDALTAFSLLFNYACIYSCYNKIWKEKKDEKVAQEFYEKCMNNLQEANKMGKYMTCDLLIMWFFDDMREQKWFQEIYAEANPVARSRN